MDFKHRLVLSTDQQTDTTLVLLHGTGGNEDDLVPLGRFLNPQATLLGIRGKVLEGAAPRFFRRLAEGVFDHEDLRFRTDELAAFLREATQEYGLNPAKLVAVGYSNGANIAASLLLRHPAVFAKAILFRSMVPYEPDVLPDLTEKRILMLSGRMDPIIPQDNSERLEQLFRASGAHVHHVWQNTGHGLTNAEFEIAQSWLTQEE